MERLKHHVMDPKPILFPLALIASSSLAMAGEPSPDLILPPDAIDYGKISGKLQTLLMHRDIDGTGHGTSATGAITLNYLSPELGGFTVGGQFIHSAQLHENGSVANPGYWLSNDDFTVFNEAWLAYDFGALGWNGAELKVGRQIINYDFAPTYNIRQKAQSFEAAILKCEPVQNLKIDLGHLERFSSWASREGGMGSTWRADFIDVAEAAGVPYHTNGFQFISAVYDPGGPWSFAAYDFYGQDLYNVFGAKAAYQHELGSAGTLTLRGHWANQQDVGRMDMDGLGPISSNIYELGVDWARNGLTLSTGAVIVNGDRYQTPFRTSFTIDTELLWYTDQFIGETNSAYLKAVYKTGNWLFYAMGVIDEHDDDTICREIDGVVKYKFNDDFYTSVKAGYGDRKYSHKSGHPHAIDIRWFLGWDF